MSASGGKADVQNAQNSIFDDGLRPKADVGEASDEFIRHLREPDHERPRIIFVTVTTTIPEMFPVAVRYGQTNKYLSP
jgi:hypothetical protein